jgi:DNA polymerase I
MRMDANFLRYSALDSVCTLEAHDCFWEQVENGFMPAYEMTMNILPVLMFMQTRGIKINKAALDETKTDVLRSAAEKQEELNRLCGRALNVNSPKDCQEYFYSELGIPPYKNKDGKPTVDDLALARLVRGTAARPGLRQAKLVQEVRGLQKLYGTYLNLEFDRDSRLRCSYNPRGTKFGRLSSSKTIFGTGTNFQNLPQEFKKFLVADDGYVFIEADKRQAEWVVVAYATGDAAMIDAVESGQDVHTHTAMRMFNVPADVVKLDHKLCGHSTDSDHIASIRSGNLELAKAMRDSGKRWPRTMSLRQCGKKSNHGLNYDEGPHGFAMINEIEIGEAKPIVEMYHAIYPGIRIWYESIKRQLQKDRTLTNCFGRSVRFLDNWGDKLWKSSYSMIPQSSVVDSLNMGMQQIYESDICQLAAMNADILAQVHDSVLIQMPIHQLADRDTFESFIERVKDYTSPEMTYSARTFKIATDFKFGVNWGEFNSEKNAGGMQEFEDYDTFMKQLNAWEKLRGEGTQIGMA